MPIPYRSCPDRTSSLMGTQRWSYEPRDIPPGLQMVEYFKPFLRHLLTLDLSRPTLRPTPRDKSVEFWAARSSANCRWTSDLPKQPIEQVVGDLIDDEGGPLLSHSEPEAEQRAFDATCRSFALPGRCRAAAAPRKTINLRRTQRNH